MCELYIKKIFLYTVLLRANGVTRAVSSPACYLGHFHGQEERNYLLLYEGCGQNGRMPAGTAFMSFVWRMLMIFSEPCRCGA